MGTLKWVLGSGKWKCGDNDIVLIKDLELRKWFMICQRTAIYHKARLQVHGLKIGLPNVLVPGCPWVHSLMLSHVMGAPCHVPCLESRDAHWCPCRLGRAGDSSERSCAFPGGPHMSVRPAQWSSLVVSASWWRRTTFLSPGRCDTLYQAWIYGCFKKKKTFWKVFRLNLTPFIALREEFEIGPIVYWSEL